MYCPLSLSLSLSRPALPTSRESSIARRPLDSTASSRNSRQQQQQPVVVEEEEEEEEEEEGKGSSDSFSPPPHRLRPTWSLGRGEGVRGVRGGGGSFVLMA